MLLIHVCQRQDVEHVILGADEGQLLGISSRESAQPRRLVRVGKAWVSWLSRRSSAPQKACTANVHVLSCCREAERRQRAAAGFQLQHSVQTGNVTSAVVSRESAQTEPFRRMTGDIVS